ncbi:RPA family protein [Halostella litorea]|uniref:RPA family protein n=1 Tax=Halostella litorea TaxID=2528831 RepID=UPI0010930607|nr:hypothetical protein [Halostella litorea]
MSESDDGGPGNREVAYRLFAAAFDDAELEFSESDEERAPNYVVTPTGARVNRLFAVGVLTEIEQVNEDVLRARVVDPTGAFVVYAGQYQPDEMAALERMNPPAFVAVTGKANTFQPDDSDRVFTSIRPESINEVDADTRDRWVVATAEQTLDRVGTFADALDLGETGDALEAALRERGVDPALAQGIPIALDHYGTTREYLGELHGVAVDAARVVAGEIDADEVGPLSLAPGEGGDEAGVEFTRSQVGEADGTTTATAEPDAERDTATDDPAEPATDDAGAAAGETEPAAEATESAAEAADPAADAESTTDTEPTTADAESTTDAESDDDAAEPAASEAGVDEATAADAEVDGEAEPAVEDDDGEEALGDWDDTADAEPSGDAVTDEESESEADAAADVGTADAGDEMYEFDEEEREQIEEEYGTEFTTGTEVDEPGEADIDIVEPGEEAADPEPTEGEPADGADEAAAEPAGDSAGADGEADAEPAADVDLDAQVIDTMEELDDGDGVPREDLVAAVVDRTGAAPGDVEDAIQDALMGGQCYESGEDTLKPI